MNLKLSGSASWAALLAVLALAPAVATLLNDRDVNALDFAVSIGSDSAVAFAGRVAVALLGLLAAWTVMKSGRGLSLPKSNNRRANLLLGSIVFFAFGHTLLPGFFGEDQQFALNILYGPLMLIVAYRAGRMSSGAAIGSVRWSLLIFILLGFIAAIIVPQMALQTEQVPLRLPFIDFRYWGLGSNPNNTAPLALMLVFFVIYQPFKSLALSVTAIGLAGLTVLLAQSQTTWTAAFVILPLYWFYRVIPKPLRKARVDPAVFVGTLVLTTAGLLMLLWELSQIDFSMLTDTFGQITQGAVGNSGSGLEDDSLNARVEIWQIALETWQDNFWFGYGPAVWDTEFRLQVGMAYAYSAHNQVMQSLSVGGAFGLASLLFYLSTLTYLSVKTAEQSNGLTVALLALIYLRGITETPLDTDTLLSGELFIHVLLVYLLATYLWREKPVRQAARSRARKRRSERSGRQGRSGSSGHVGANGSVRA